LGSVRGLVDDSVSVSQAVDYSAYGEPDGALLGFAFTGEMREANGLQYHRARYYNPTLGVWAALDPFEGTQERPMSMNGYSWVEGNVTNWTDPSGMYSCNSEDETMQSACRELDTALNRATNVSIGDISPIVALCATMGETTSLKQYLRQF